MLCYDLLPHFMSSYVMSCCVIFYCVGVMVCACMCICICASKCVHVLVCVVRVIASISRDTIYKHIYNCNTWVTYLLTLHPNLHKHLVV